MGIILDKPCTTTTQEIYMRGEDLPKKFRGNYPKKSVISVAMKEVLTENWFTPEEEREILEAEEEAEKGINVSWPFEWNELLEHLNKITNEN